MGSTRTTILRCTARSWPAARQREFDRIVARADAHSRALAIRIQMGSLRDRMRLVSSPSHAMTAIGMILGTAV